MKIIAAVDGSSLGNPGPAGWAWVVNRDVWDAGGWRRGTNNLGELTAVLELLQATERAGLANRPLHILADSQYVINGLTKWMPGWKKRGWKKADGKPVANRALFEKLDAALVGRPVTFEWVRGHSGHTLNEAADDLARGAAEAYQAGREVNPGPGFTGEAHGEDRSHPSSIEEETRIGATVASPAPTFTESMVTGRWSELLSLAEQTPVRIVRAGRSPLVILNADLVANILDGQNNLAVTEVSEPERDDFLF